MASQSSGASPMLGSRTRAARAISLAAILRVRGNLSLAGLFRGSFVPALGQFLKGLGYGEQSELVCSVAHYLREDTRFLRAIAPTLGIVRRLRHVRNSPRYRCVPNTRIDE